MDSIFKQFKNYFLHLLLIWHYKLAAANDLSLDTSSRYTITESRTQAFSGKALSLFTAASSGQSATSYGSIVVADAFSAESNRKRMGSMSNARAASITQARHVQTSSSVGGGDESSGRGHNDVKSRSYTAAENVEATNDHATQSSTQKHIGVIGIPIDTGSPQMGQASSTKGPDITLSVQTSSLASSEASKYRASRLTGNGSQIITPLASGDYLLHHTQTLLPDGSTTVLSGTTYSVLSSGSGVVVNGQTIAKSKTSQVSQLVHGLHVKSETNGVILIDGHSLTMSTTLTLGSGSVVTQLALTTNTVGKTVLLGDVSTRHPGVSSSARYQSSSEYLLSSSAEVLSSTRANIIPSTSARSPELASLGSYTSRTSWKLLWTTNVIIAFVVIAS